MSTDTTPASIGADAWMDPDTRDVINAERKQSWLDDYGIGGRAKAATYTVPLVRAALAGAAPAAQGDVLDAARLDYLIESRAIVVSDPDSAPGYWLEFISPGADRWVQIGEYPTPRAAIDAARAAKEGGEA